MILRLFYVLLLVLLHISLPAQNNKYTFQRPKMGSPFIITAYADDSVKLAFAVEKAYQYVDTLNQIFSDYSATSEISLLCKKEKKGEWQTVSPILYTVLKMSLEAAQQSGGAFDITVGNLVKLWRKARKEKQLPDKQLLKVALLKTGWKQVELSEKMLKIRFHTDRTFRNNREGVQLDFGGIVKGYAAQEVVRILTESGFPSCLADAGGDLVVGEKPLGDSSKWHFEVQNALDTEGGWLIGIGVPQSDNKLLPQFLKLQNQAVATSGDMYNYLEIKGKRYSHIVNPKTGLGLTHQRNVTIVAPDGALADWLATACSVLPIKKALRLVKNYPNTDILILEKHKGKIKMWQSMGFSKYFSSN